METTFSQQIQTKPDQRPERLEKVTRQIGKWLWLTELMTPKPHVEF